MLVNLSGFFLLQYKDTNISIIFILLNAHVQLQPRHG